MQICMEREKKNVFVPCGHQCVCQVCAERIMASEPPERRCPVCREQPVMQIRVYRGGE